MATGAMIALAVVSAGMEYKASRDQAKATVQAEANNAERNKALTFAKASSQKASFLASGITLEGTPLSVMNSTYDVGKQDIDTGIANANRASRNIIGAANTQLVGSIAQIGVSSMGEIGSSENMAGQSSGFNPATSAPLAKPSFGGTF